MLLKHERVVSDWRLACLRVDAGLLGLRLLLLWLLTDWHSNSLLLHLLHLLLLLKMRRHVHGVCDHCLLRLLLLLRSALNKLLLLLLLWIDEHRRIGRSLRLQRWQWLLLLLWMSHHRMVMMLLLRRWSCRLHRHCHGSHATSDHLLLLMLLLLLLLMLHDIDRNVDWHWLLLL